ncbi:hypothetical protein JMA_32550 [Jeotgalibacillus malaysiensis]|uniref:Uncharacterized protein n=1 Tax=Jeotgalibacillus malaysiensis TaxID=1508404 RepID=A0A0B5AV01_9BACL|nr:hypothetical protein JMA_32550 [Jeotgalibacillus malaysiensis]
MKTASDIFSSKKFAPVYFIASALSAILFLFLNFPLPLIGLLSGSCLVPGFIFLNQE